MRKIFLMTGAGWHSRTWRRLQPPPTRRLPGAIFLALLAFLAVQAWSWGPAPAAAPQGEVLEDLKFQVEYLLWKEVAQAQLTLKSQGPGHYQAEISGEPLGLLKMITGKRRDSYRTEMILRHGKLVPLVYREESQKKGHRHLKEYRFNYDQGVLELWQLKEGKGMAEKWHTALKAPIYDPLTAFYNCRLGLMGPIREGETFKVAGIPYPKPEEIEVRIGPESAEGRKIMIGINNKAFENDRGVIFAYLDEARVPALCPAGQRRGGRPAADPGRQQPRPRAAGDRRQYSGCRSGVRLGRTLQRLLRDSGIGAQTIRRSRVGFHCRSAGHLHAAGR